MITDYPKKIILKDNSECIFSIADSASIVGVEDLFKRVSPEDIWVMPRDYTRSESVRHFIDSFNPDDDIHLMIHQKGKLIGIGILHHTCFGAKKHIGEVEVIIDESFKQKRLGTWIILELTGIAQELKLEIIKIELVAGKDDAAITASRRLNFIPQATLKNYLQDQNGRWVDMVILVKEIHESWSDY